AVGARVLDSPVRKVLELLDVTQGKLVAEAEKAQAVYEELAEWCEDRSRSLRVEIKTAKSRASSLSAVIEQSSYKVTSVTTRIEELSGEIAAQEKELSTATTLREKEAKTFTEYEQGLTETIQAIEQAIHTLDKSGSGASLLQRQSAMNAVQALVAMVDGYGIRASGFEHPESLAQTTGSSREGDASQDEDSELSLDAPDSAAYASKSGGIVNTLEGLLDRATSDLSDLRRDEATKAGNYKLFKQSLDTKMGYSKAEMGQARVELAAAGQKKAAAEGDLSMGNKDLQEDVASLEKLHHHCMSQAADFESETTARNQELGVLAKAKKLIGESTAGAEGRTYGLAQRSAQGEGSQQAAPAPTPVATDAADSFLQLGRADQSGLRAARLIKRLAKERKSRSLTQLFRYMDSVLRSKGSSAEDPFAKVRSMVSSMIARMEEEASKEADHKAYCDKEMAETQAKVDDKAQEISKVSTIVDQQSAESAKVVEEITTLQEELSDIVQSQKSMDEIRSKQKAMYEQETEELQRALQGTQAALRVLRDYYSKDDDGGQDSTSQSGPSSGVMGLLEVMEGDFSKRLYSIESEEGAAQAAYEEDSKDNAIATAEKEKIVSLKIKASKALGKSAAEMGADRDSLQAEADAVGEFQAKLLEQCVAKAEPYEEKVKRREKEMDGLREALQILDGQAVSFLQQGASAHRRQLRGPAV
ncbi:unnamed protein product, partial [Prorocentrum cordatum]